MTTPSALHPTLAAVTDRIVERSAEGRAEYVRRIDAAGQIGPARGRLACANLAHGFAASEPTEKQALRGRTKPNVAIVSSYNDMLSAHQPYRDYPEALKKAVIRGGGIAQFAGGVPAMCDGITQGRDGMQLSLYSRDVIAMSTAIALSHDMFDGALMLGVCDKITPGLLIGALSFGHLPTVFVPAGPMTSGPAELREGTRAPAVRRGQGRPRRAARGRGGVVPLRRHVHLLRHRELQPAADGGARPAPARLVVRQPRARRCARR